MTNFDFLKSDPQFATFSDVAISAEKILNIDAAASVLNCRRAMEFAVKWMYSVDKDLEMPYDTTLVALMSTEEFRDVVGNDLLFRMTYIRKRGNDAAHSGNRISLEQAKLCVENLYIFMDFVACCYSEKYNEIITPFDKALLEKPGEDVPDKQKELDFEKLIAENKALKDELTARRTEQQQTYVPKPLDLSEFKTRKIYIDTMLQDAGWVENDT